MRFWQGVTVSVQRTPADAVGDFSIPLASGRNAIGDPFHGGVAVSDLKFGGLTFGRASSDNKGVVRPILLVPC